MFRALTRLQRHNHTSLLAPNKTYAFLPTSTHTHFTPRRTTQVQLRMFALTPYRSNQPRTFSRQGELARLPVPEVRDSLERWLASLRPVVAEKYGDENAEREMAKRRELVEDFVKPGGVGEKLQQRLKDLDASSPNNWLNDTLWTPLAYHTWRAPLLINSNWWLLFKHDPIMPEYDQLVAADEPNPMGAAAREVKSEVAELGGKNKKNEWYEANCVDVGARGVTEVQVRRAAWLTGRFLDFRRRLIKEEILPDSSRSGPFDMYQYTRLFGVTRVPQPGCDTFAPVDPSARHITVMIDDTVYAVDVLDERGEPVAVAAIETRLWEAVKDAQGQGRGDTVGVLSADDRDKWAQNYQRLVSLDPRNQSTIKSIESSIFGLSLDTYTMPPAPPSLNTDPYTRPIVDAHVRNTSSGINGGNRWFDKALTVMVETNGRAGMMGEHSPCDALIPSIVVDYALGVDVDVSAFEAGAKREGDGGGWKRCEFVLDDALRKEIGEAEARAREIVMDSDAQQLWWDRYGAEWIKKSGKQSPDAFIQMALQLAWYKTRHGLTATYETASTRMFLHGRTEVIRTLSEPSRAFVHAMVDPKRSDAERFNLLSQATSHHNALTRASSVGKGFDRHLMALKYLGSAGKGEVLKHPLFDDDMWALSQEWKLSTSGLSAGGRFLGTGFGTIWPDGLGTNYLAGPYLIKFGLESKNSGPVSTSEFKIALAESLAEMCRVCDAAQSAEQGAPTAARL